MSGFLLGCNLLLPNPAFKIKNKVSTSYKNTAVSKKRKEKRLAEHMTPKLGNIFRPVSQERYPDSCYFPRF
ncbi:BFP_1a_G0005880.mRNA.1.CDS.1 [Saccharomyces cerevisiae]|nr:BFP_1a_G0005880.mRNA.1.CDS.1 [Saccharomyces cerevisiae]CAI7055951.1 BFP_1a_G0005880.mRNA.1.CDS.1 [Saccharomyces cerevisiae]